MNCLLTCPAGAFPAAMQNALLYEPNHAIVPSAAMARMDRHVATDALFEIIHAYWDDTYELEIEGSFEPIATMLTATFTSKTPSAFSRLAAIA
jgi:hypothetical protein